MVTSLQKAACILAAVGWIAVGASSAHSAKVTEETLKDIREHLGSSAAPKWSPRKAPDSGREFPAFQDDKKFLDDLTREFSTPRSAPPAEVGPRIRKTPRAPVIVPSPDTGEERALRALDRAIQEEVLRERRLP